MATIPLNGRQVEVPDGDRDHDEGKQALQGVAVSDGGEHPGDAFEAHFDPVLLVLLVARRA